MSEFTPEQLFGLFLTILFLGFVAYRITRLIVIDEITEPPRDALVDALVERDNKVTDKLVYLITCTWCAGFWVSLLVYAIFLGDSPHTFGRVDWITVFGVAGVQGLLHALEPDES